MAKMQQITKASNNKKKTYIFGQDELQEQDPRKTKNMIEQTRPRPTVFIQAKIRPRHNIQEQDQD